MVILSSVICDTAGKILIARQFETLSKHNLEENIHSFPKMIQPNQQHTFVENDKIRYVYMPLDNLYLVLITSKNSNIIEHQETIRLLYKVILELCSQGISEETVIENAFDIALAFDDVISFGYRESISLPQVQNALEMESSEEKLHQMLMQARMNEAKENALKHQQDKLKKGGGSSTADIDISKFGIQKDFTSTQDVLEETSYKPEKQSAPSGATNKAPKKGMQLGKKKKTAKETQQEMKKQAQESKKQKQASKNELEDAIDQEDSKKPLKFDPLKEPVTIDLIEKMSVKLTRDGSCANNLEIVGELYLTVLDPSKTKTQVALEASPGEKFQNVKLNLHPNLNKQLWNKNKIISMKKPDQEDFPVGQKVPTLKYKYISQDNSELPFTFTFWFDTTVILELEFNGNQTHFKSLDNLVVRIPYTDSSSNINIKNIENGDFKIEDGEGITWNVPKLDEDDNLTATIEIDFDGKVEEEDLFPLNFYFEHPETFYNINVRGVREVTNSENLKHIFKSELQADKLYIE